MRFVTYAELMQLPKGTIAHAVESDELGQPFVFGGQIGDSDFTRANFLPEQGHASYYGGDKAVLAKWGVGERDWVVHYPTNFGRDGYYETKRMYLVWEQADRAKFAAWLLDPALCAKEQNDDPHVMLKVPR